MPVRSLRDGALTIEDAASSPNTQTVSFVEGGLQWTQARPANFHSDRGSLDHAREANEAALEGSCSFRFQDTTIRDALIDANFSGTAGTASLAQTIYSGWQNPETDAVVQCGATLFGDTAVCGTTIGGSSTSSGAADEGEPVDLLFEITDPSTGSIGERLLFMAVYVEEFTLEEGDPFDEASFSFRTPVREPHRW